MRIGISTNSPWVPSGYANQMALFFQSGRIGKLGHEIVAHSNYGLGGSPMDIGGIVHYPCMKDAPGNLVLPHIVKAENLDLLITLYDSWVFDPSIMIQLPWSPWFPLDHDPIPPGIREIVRTAKYPIVYSRFAQKRFTEAGIPVRFVPHGIDTSFFTPFTPEQRNAARHKVGFKDDHFIISIVAANVGYPSRKSFDQQVQAFARFSKRHDDAVLYIHADWDGAAASGVNIAQIVDLAGLGRDKVACPPQAAYMLGAIEPEYVHSIYAMSDLLSSCSMGEGFCLPMAEAMSSGTPVVATDFSAMPELIDAGGAGWKVGFDKFITPIGSYQAYPHIDEIEAAYEAAYAARGDQDVRDQVRAGMIANYDVNYVTETFWRPVLASIEAEIAEGKKAQSGRALQRELFRIKTVEETGATDEIFSSATVLQSPPTGQ